MGGDLAPTPFGYLLAVAGRDSPSLHVADRLTVSTRVYIIS